MRTPKPFYKRHEDDEWIDEIRVKVVPRYKTSGLSGNEWRVSALVQFSRKGVVLRERRVHRIRDAAMAIPWMLIDDAPVGDDEDRKFPDEDSWCFQPGCTEKAVSIYRLKTEGCPRCGTQKTPAFAEVRRAFCRKHLRRGDAGLDDADDNYEVVSGPGPDEAQGWEQDESPSIFGGTITVTPKTSE